MKLITSIATKSFTIVLALYLLVVNTGISYSHVWCSQGSRWLLGTEMPPCKLAKAKTTCPYTQKECSDKNKSYRNSDSKEQRKKKSFTFDFKFAAEVNSSHSAKVTSFLKFSLFNSACIDETISKYRWNTFAIKHSNRAHPPPQLNKPLLSKIQVYRI